MNCTSLELFLIAAALFFSTLSREAKSPTLDSNSTYLSHTSLRKGLIEVSTSLLPYLALSGGIVASTFSKSTRVLLSSIMEVMVVSNLKCTISHH